MPCCVALPYPTLYHPNPNHNPNCAQVSSPAREPKSSHLPEPEPDPEPAPPVQLDECLANHCDKRETIVVTQEEQGGWAGWQAGWVSRVGW